MPRYNIQCCPLLQTIYDQHASDLGSWVALPPSFVLTKIWSKLFDAHSFRRYRLLFTVQLNSNLCVAESISVNTLNRTFFKNSNPRSLLLFPFRLFPPRGICFFLWYIMSKCAINPYIETLRNFFLSLILFAMNVKVELKWIAKLIILVHIWFFLVFGWVFCLYRLYLYLVN